MEQCKKMKQQRGELEETCNAVFEHVEFEAFFDDPDALSLKTWIVTAARETNSVVAVIAEALHAGYKELTCFGRCIESNEEIRVMSQKRGSFGTPCSQ